VTAGDSGLKEIDPIEKAEKDFFKIVEEEKAKKKKRQVFTFIFKLFFLQGRVMFELIFYLFIKRTSPISIQKFTSLITTTKNNRNRVEKPEGFILLTFCLYIVACFKADSRDFYPFFSSILF
jgi:hypothetical protein